MEPVCKKLKTVNIPKGLASVTIPQGLAIDLLCTRLKKDIRDAEEVRGLVNAAAARGKDLRFEEEDMGTVTGWGKAGGSSVLQGLQTLCGVAEDLHARNESLLEQVRVLREELNLKQLKDASNEEMEKELKRLRKYNVFGGDFCQPGKEVFKNEDKFENAVMTCINARHFVTFFLSMLHANAGYGGTSVNDAQMLKNIDHLEHMVKKKRFESGVDFEVRRFVNKFKGKYASTDDPV